MEKNTKNIIENHKTFNKILGNSLISSITNFFVWFALTYWIYLETKSIIATSIIAGMFAVTNALSAFVFGSIVDHNKKKTVMTYSSLISLLLYIAGTILYFTNPVDSFKDISSITLWILVAILMLGTIVGNLRSISLATSVSLLLPSSEHDKANGKIGMVNGISFSLTSVASGLMIGFVGMGPSLLAATIITLLVLIHLYTININEEKIVDTDQNPKNIDISGTIKIINQIPGLFALIFFTTFNNFLGGVFMALMDAYGLSLVSVQTWGILWGFLSLGFIGGGILISKLGLGANPLKTLFKINLITWSVCIFFVIQPSIVLTAIGILIRLICTPFIEASESTIIQKVVPYERQGRVFGFAQSIESAAAPITAFLIGPLTQLIFIPFMTTGAGVKLIGNRFGVGEARGIALVFIIAGIIGLIATLLAFRSKYYKLLSNQYIKNNE